MTDVDRIGGVPVVLRALLDAGLLHGDALTVTGKTMAENLAEIAPPDPDGAIIHAMNDPIHKTGGLSILRGSLAPEGAVVKSAGFDADDLRGHRPGLRRRAGRDGRRHRGHPAARRRRRHPVRGPQGRPGHARDARRHRRDQGRRAWARTSCCSPTAASPAGRRGCASGTSRRRRPTAARSPSSATATGSGWTSPPAPSTCWSTRPSWPRRREGWEPLPPALHHRRARQVRQARRLGGPGRHLRLIARDTPGRGEGPSAPPCHAR